MKAGVCRGHLCVAKRLHASDIGTTKSQLLGRDQSTNTNLAGPASFAYGPGTQLLPPVFCLYVHHVSTSCPLQRPCGAWWHRVFTWLGAQSLSTTQQQHTCKPMSKATLTGA